MAYRILEEIIQTVGVVHQSCHIITRKEPELARQIRRAVTSVGLNAAEGLHALGGNRSLRLESAMNSGREVVAGLRIAAIAGYLEPTRALQEADAVDRIVAILYKLARPKR